MSENTVDVDDAAEADERQHKNLAVLVYVLQGLGLFTDGLTCIAALVINYLKADEVRDTWLESHFRWQINTFWYGLLWSVLAWMFWIILLGWFFTAVVTVWIVYRIVKGALYLNDNKAIIF